LNASYYIDTIANHSLRSNKNALLRAWIYNSATKQNFQDGVYLPCLFCSSHI